MSEDVSQNLDVEARSRYHKIYAKKVMHDIEEYIYDFYQNNVNQQYRAKIEDVLSNLKLLKTNQFVELADLFFKRKVFSVKKFCQKGPSFKEFLTKVLQQRTEKRKKVEIDVKPDQDKDQPDIAVEDKQIDLKTSDKELL